MIPTPKQTKGGWKPASSNAGHQVTPQARDSLVAVVADGGDKGGPREVGESQVWKYKMFSNSSLIARAFCQYTRRSVDGMVPRGMGVREGGE